MDHRQALNCIFWLLRTGASWTDVPPPRPALDLQQRRPALKQARRSDRLLGSVSKAHDDGLRRIDATSARVRQRAAGPNTYGRPGGMRRQRVGLTNRIYPLVDAENRPVALKITEDEALDGRAAVDLLGAG